MSLQTLAILTTFTIRVPSVNKHIPSRSRLTVHVENFGPISLSGIADTLLRRVIQKKRSRPILPTPKQLSPGIHKLIAFYLSLRLPLFLSLSSNLVCTLDPDARPHLHKLLLGPVK